MTGDEAKQVLAEIRPTLLKVAGRIVRANGLSSEDAVQDAYLKALRAIEAGSFPQERGHLLAWFTRVVYSAVYDALRGRARRMARVPAVLDREPADDRPGPLDQLVEWEDEGLIRRSQALLASCIGQLPGEERRAVELRFQGMTNRQIALALDVPLGSVSALFRSVMGKLRRGLAAAGSRADPAG
jgi:RNA polymerase sigma factor (sigma-70 family)